MQRSNILLTTTPILEGWEIIRYLKPLSAHYVIGSNIISDIFASWSDFLGGSSNTYQRKLKLIYEEVTEQLKKSAYEIGANAVIGMSIDVGEISGKGKNMFMITAIGTAIIAIKKNNTENNKQEPEKTEHVSFERIAALKKKKSLLEELASNSLSKIDDATWDFIIENKLHEIGNPIIDIIIRSSPSDFSSADYEFQKNYSKVIEYFLCLDYKKSVELLYNRLLIEEAETSLKLLFKIIKETMLLDFEKVKEHLFSNDFNNQKKVLQLLMFDKPSYDYGDIDALNGLIIAIDDAFKERGRKTFQKNLISSKEKEMWICECGLKHSEKTSYCSNCGNDIYGFGSDLLSPEKAKEILKEKAELIRQCLQDS